MSLRNTKYTSLDSVFVGLRRLGINDTSEKDVVELSGQALELIGAITQYEDAICFIHVKNHRASLPNGLHSINQLARNSCHKSKEDRTAVTAQDILKQYQQTTPDYSVNGEGCTHCNISDDPRQYGHTNQGLNGIINTTAFDFNTYVPIPLDCFGEPIDEMSLGYYRPYFDLQYEYSPWINSPIHQNCFTPIHLATNSFFGTEVDRDGQDDSNIDVVGHNHLRDEYIIVNKDTLKFSFKEGQIAIAYTRAKLDSETGWPMLPDNASYINACIYFNIWKAMEKEFYSNREGAEKRMATAEQQWIWYCGQAGNNALMLKGVDEYQNFMDGRNHMIPKLNRYSDFFGKLGSPENRKFNNPDFKNSRASIFRGYEI